MKNYRVWANRLDAGKTIYKISIGTNGAAGYRLYDDFEMFAKDLATDFSVTESVIQRFRGGETKHEQLADQRLSDERANYYGFPSQPPARALRTPD